MFRSRETWVRVGVPCALLVALAGCAPKPARPPSVETLMHDRVALDGVVMKCNGDLNLARTDPLCAVARIAIDRLAERRDAAEAAKREVQFEQRREELRLAEEQRRLEREEAEKVDAYTLPIVPIDPTAVPTVSKSPSPGATSSSGAPKRAPASAAARASSTGSAAAQMAATVQPLLGPFPP